MSSLQHIRDARHETKQKSQSNKLDKKTLVHTLCLVALNTCRNHIERLNVCQQLADENKQPMKFMTKNHYYYLFSCGTIDLKYEDDGKKWTLEFI